MVAPTMTNLPVYLNQMWLGQVPLLTKGPFALLYGGQEIVPQLSKVGTAVTAVADVTAVTNMLKKLSQLSQLSQV